MSCKTCGGTPGNHKPSLLDRHGVGDPGHKVPSILPGNPPAPTKPAKTCPVCKGYLFECQDSPPHDVECKPCFDCNGTGNVEGVEPAKRIRCTEHQGLPDNVLLGCLACANAASEPNMAWKPCTACNERFPVGQEPTHCAECHQPLHDTHECRDKHTQERHHRAPTKTTPNVRDINVPKTTGSAELDTVLTQLCSRARLAYKSDEPFKNQAKAKDIARAAIQAHTARQVEAEVAKALLMAVPYNLRLEGNGKWLATWEPAVPTPGLPTYVSGRSRTNPLNAVSRLRENLVTAGVIISPDTEQGEVKHG